MVSFHVGGMYAISSVHRHMTSMRRGLFAYSVYFVVHSERVLSYGVAVLGMYDHEHV